MRTFYIGLAALQVGHDVQADAKLAQFTQLAAERTGRLGQLGPPRTTTTKLRHRRRATPESARSRARQQRHSITSSDCSKAVAATPRKQSSDLRKSVELDQKNLIAIYKLAEEVERQGDEKSTKSFNRLFKKFSPCNPTISQRLVELSRVAAKRGDAET